MLKVIAIDLDDTLLDTTGLLTPKATTDTFQFLIDHGLSLSLSECENKRIEWVKIMSHRDVIEKICIEYGNTHTQTIIKQAIDLFYNYPIPTQLPLLSGAQKNLDYIKNKYAFYLVTAGIAKSQFDKVKALNIANYFKSVFVVNSILKKRKKDSFLEILSREKIQANELLCIGNSIASEITDALSIGAQACYFQHGEVRGTLNDLPRPPQYLIRQHSELIKACHL